MNHNLFLVLVFMLLSGPVLGQAEKEVAELKKLVGLQQAQLMTLQMRFDEVIKDKKWVGDPSGLQGPPGRDGQPGQPGPKGSFSSCRIDVAESGSARCVAGEVLTGGGCSSNILGDAVLRTSAPFTDNSMSWFCVYNKSGGANASASYAICCK